MPIEGRAGPPDRIRGEILRRRLLRTLRQRFELPVVCVTAGAGFGKTTLLAQAVRENLLSPEGIDHWVRCTNHDADACRLGAAIGAVLGGIRPTSLGSEAWADAIADRLWTAAPERTALILDDLHRIAPDSDGCAMVALLLDRLPANATLVLSSRGEPPVPLARRRAAGEVLDIDEDDLRFTVGELGALGMSGDVADAVLAATGGWPAPAVLRISGHHGDVVRFLRQEVLVAMSPAVRRALAAVVVLGGADPGVLGAALGDDPPSEELTRLPLVATDDRGNVVAHDLWCEALDGQLETAEEETLSRRAAETLVERGEIEAALMLLADAGDWRRVLEIVRDEAHDQEVPTIGAPVLEDLRRRLPSEHRETLLGGVLDLLVARDESQHDNSVADRAAVLARRSRDEGDDAAELAALVQFQHDAWFHGDTSGVARAACRLAELAERLPRARWSSLESRMLSADLRGDHGQVLALLGDLPADLPPRFLVRARWMEAMAQIRLGRPHDARGPAAAVAELSPDTSVRRRTPQLWALALSGCFADVVALGIRAGTDPRGTVRDRFLSGCGFAYVYAQAGRVDLARDALGVAEANVVRDPPLALRSQLVLARVLVEVAAGDELAAASLLAELRAEAPQDHPDVDRSLRPFVAVLRVLHPDGQMWAVDDLGPADRDAFELGQALVQARRGQLGAATRVAATDPDIWAMRLGVGLAVELAVAMHGGGEEARARSIAKWLVDFSPVAVREALRRLSRDGHLAQAARALSAAVPVRPDATLELQLLGPTRLLRDGVVVDDADWRRERVRALLTHLVARRRVRRAELAAELWPDLDPHGASRNLRTTLGYLQRVLEPDRAARDATWFVRQELDDLVLVADDHLGIDVDRFERAIADGDRADRDGAPSRALEHFCDAVAQWRGEALPDGGEARWVQLERDRLRAGFVHAAVRAGELETARGEPERSVDLASAALRAEPWSEQAYRVLIAAHLARGDRAAARRAADTCLHMLGDLGLEPAPESEPLLQRVGAHRPSTVGSLTRR